MRAVKVAQCAGSCFARRSRECMPLGGASSRTPEQDRKLVTQVIVPEIEVHTKQEVSSLHIHSKGTIKPTYNGMNTWAR